MRSRRRSTGRCSAGVHVINLSLGTANPAHEARLAAALARARGRRRLPGGGRRPGRRPLAARQPAGRGGGAARLGVPARRGADRVDGPAPGLAIVVAASGYPRPIPGVSPERNLKGVSFAVANATGLLALHLSRPVRGLTPAGGSPGRRGKARQLAATHRRLHIPASSRPRWHRIRAIGARHHGPAAGHSSGKRMCGRRGDKMSDPSIFCLQSKLKLAIVRDRSQTAEA